MPNPPTFHRARTTALLCSIATAACSGTAQLATHYAGPPSPGAVALAVPNDNRLPAGTLRRGVRSVRLEARLAAWRPDLNVDSTVTVRAFAEESGAPRIPGPLLRAEQGMEVRVSVRNAIPDSTLVVHGLRAGTVAEDTLHIAPGATREVRFRAGVPGTYLYWGTTDGDSTIADRLGRDTQLTGVIVVDPRGAVPDPAERILVMTLIDIWPDSAARRSEEVWEVAINGMSWPHTERLEYPVDDTVRWRWVNGTDRVHPMHLHGFHFRVLAKGNGHADTTYTANRTRLAVTEFMLPGSTFRMDWVPTRAGNWLMHCHMIPHITPYPERPDSTRGHDLHDVARHPLDAMAGLVIGVTTWERNKSAAAVAAPTRRLRLFAQQADSGNATPRGYVLQRGTEPRPDSVEVPGTPLILMRGETTAITVVNRLREPTTVHWHGMELESVYDGVSGWSRTGTNLAPLLPPGDSFTVAFTPPRAGTFIYHTHMDEGTQLGTGMYGPLLVMEPGDRYDPSTDLVLTIGEAVSAGKIGPALNGRPDPPALTLRPGTRYRLRIINIHPVEPVRVALTVDTTAAVWRHRAKDGADLPPALRVEGPARLRIGVGETYDFDWTPTAPLDAVLEIRFPGGRPALRQQIRVR